MLQIHTEVVHDGIDSESDPPDQTDLLDAAPRVNSWRYINFFLVLGVSCETNR